MTGCISRFFFGLVWFLMKKPIKQAMNMQEGLLQRITTDEKTKQQILMRISQNKKQIKFQSFASYYQLFKAI